MTNMEIPIPFDHLIDRWEELRAQGAAPTADELCADCPELAPELRRRIAALEAMESALDTAECEPASANEEWDLRRGDPACPTALHASAVYRPQGRLDEGGLGVIDAAHQDELDRTVALKRIRPDRLREMSRKRFLREAVITARLQHPGIVPIYGLGHGDDGPFYTMPLIRGQTLQRAIEAFHSGDTKRGAGRSVLQFRGLLQHFVAVCNTIAYSHDQGVVHRDLKPSNIMIGPYGETLVLDWGLAKCVGDVEPDGKPQPANEADAPSRGRAGAGELTTPGEVLGTPQYMSPEQAKGEPAAPAGDVFCLGLVLYAILTGRSAFSAANQRVDEELDAVWQAAIVPPRSLNPSLPRALEAVCLKALAARAHDRYQSARALADDVTSWLAGEPVSAWREPLAARARRWARRHRTAVVAAVIAVVTGAAGLGSVVAVQARANAQLQGALARSEESRRQAETVRRFLVDAFSSPDPARDGRNVKMAEILDRAATRLDREFSQSSATKGALLHTLGTTYQGLGLYDRAATLLAQARTVHEAALGPDHVDTLASRNNLANAYTSLGRTREAIALHEETLRIRATKLGPDHPDTLGSCNNLAIAYMAAGRVTDTLALHERTLKRKEARLGRDHPDVRATRTGLAVTYAAVGKLSDAIALNKANLKDMEMKLGPDHPETMGVRSNLAANYVAAGRYTDAIALHRETLERREARLGPDHPDTLASRNKLADVLRNAGRWSEALEMNRATLRAKERVLGADHPDTLMSRHNLAMSLLDAGRFAEAIALHRQALEAREARLGPEHPDVLVSRTMLADACYADGRYAEALLLHRQTLEAYEDLLGASHPNTIVSRNGLANAYTALGRVADAAVLYDENLRRIEAALGPAHPYALITRGNLATAYEDLGR
jgi:tetratricopeptide (TPR) repeat protein